MKTAGGGGVRVFAVEESKVKDGGSGDGKARGERRRRNRGRGGSPGKTEGKKGGASSSRARVDFACDNCGKEGHSYFECKKPLAPGLELRKMRRAAGIEGREKTKASAAAHVAFEESASEDDAGLSHRLRRGRLQLRGLRGSVRDPGRCSTQR